MIAPPPPTDGAPAPARAVRSASSPSSRAAGRARGDRRGRGAEPRAPGGQGKVTYRIYCSNCHGVEGKGDGKLADLLTVQPADLADRILKKDDGELPAERVRAAIDGRAEVAGHGFRDMPVWGDAFQPTDAEMPDPEKVQAAQAKISELGAYLKTIQQE